MAGSKRKWTDEQLIEAVQEATGMASCMELLGLKKSAAGNRSTVKKYIEKLGLSTEHWLGQSWVQKGWQEIPLEEILVERSTYKTWHLRNRLLRSGMKEHKCESCSRSEWLGVPIPLELDHVNGVNNDHRLENLRLLCPNCHALTPTWRGRNKRLEAQVGERSVEAGEGVSSTLT